MFRFDNPDAFLVLLMTAAAYFTVRAVARGSWRWLALVGVALAPALLMGLRRTTIARRKLARMAAVCVLLAMAPFAAWTWRNWQVFHVFEPLAPRYTNDPGQQAIPGQFDLASPFFKGLAHVRLNDESYAYIDRTGRIIFNYRP